jgi:hypothetical protein
MSQFYGTSQPPRFDILSAPTIDARVHKIEKSGMFNVMSEITDVYEAVHFRSHVSRTIQRLVDLSETREQRLICEVSTTTVPLPSHFPKMFPVVFFFGEPLSPMTINIMCSGLETLSEALQKAVSVGIPEQQHKGKVLRIHGTRIYALSPSAFSTPLQSIAFVRESVLRRRRVGFCAEPPPPCAASRSNIPLPPMFGSVDSDPDAFCETVQCIPITSIPPEFMFPIRILGIERILPRDFPKEILRSY